VAALVHGGAAHVALPPVSGGAVNVAGAVVNGIGGGLSLPATNCAMPGALRSAKPSWPPAAQ